MNDRMAVHIFFECVAFLLMTGCFREPICNETSRYAVRFEIDSAGLLHMMPENIERIRFSLYDPDTEKEVFMTFFSGKGGYLYSVEPGTYKVAAWSMNSDYTSVTYADRYDLLTAESMTVQQTPVRVIAAPDHVFAYSSEEMTIPYVTEDDAEVVFPLPLKSVVDTWRIEVENVKGLENFSSANFFISNQTREIYFKQWKRSGSAVSRAFGRVEGDKIICEFGSFGMGEDEKVSVIVRILAHNGSVYEKTFDVTNQINDSRNTGHIIKIQFDTTLIPLEQGGLQPSAEDWNENIDVIDLT